MGDGKPVPGDIVIKTQGQPQRIGFLPDKALDAHSAPRKLAVLASITQPEQTRLESLFLQTLRHFGYRAQLWQPAFAFRCDMLVAVFNQVFGSKEADFLAQAESVIVVFDETGEKHAVDLFASLKQIRGSLRHPDYVHALRLHKDRERPRSYWRFRTMLAKHLDIALFESVEPDEQLPLPVLVQRTLEHVLKRA